MKNKIFTLMVAIMVMLGGFSAKADLYNLEVGDVFVTDKNKDNITGKNISGSVVFDSENRVLTLNNARIVSEEGYAINCNMSGVKIVIENDVVLEGRFAGIAFNESSENPVITGNGVNKSRLYASSTHGASIRAWCSSVTLDNLSADLNGFVESVSSETALNIKNSYVKIVTYDEVFPVYEFKFMTLEGCEITTPAGAVFDETQKTVVLNGEPVTGTVEIRNPKVVVEYPLWVGGIQVTNKNQDNITGSGITGTVSYNPDSKVLLLKDATIKNNENTGVTSGIESNIPNLEIQIDGTADIESNSTGISVGQFRDTETRIYGTGSYKDKLNVNSQSGVGISVKNTDLYLDNLVADINGGKGIIGIGTETVYINADAKVTAKSDVISHIGMLVLEYCEITAPAGAAFDETLGAVAAEGKIVTGTTMEIKSDHPYGFTVGGVLVTEKNKDNITGEGITGTVTYNPEIKVLLLKDATIEVKIEREFAILNFEEQNLKIKVEGTVNLKSVNNCLYTVCDLLIFGSGVTNSKINIVSENSCSIVINETDLKIENVTLNAISFWGITGVFGEDVVIKNSNVTASSISDIESLTLDGCFITAPAGAAFDAEMRGVALDGEIVYDTIKIETDGSGVEGVKADEVEDPNAPMYNVMGQQIREPYYGQIYIQNGRKKVWLK